MTYGVDIFPPFFFKAVFYITGGFSLIWCILWFIFLSDEPRDHKCIGEKEINFIETNRTVTDVDEEHDNSVVIYLTRKYPPTLSRRKNIGPLTK